MSENVIDIGIEDAKRLRLEKDLAEAMGPEATGHSVIIGGRLVPNMTMIEEANGDICLMLDSRLGWIFPRDLAVHAASFAANAMAIGAGFPCFHADRQCDAFAPKVSSITQELDA